MIKSTRKIFLFLAFVLAANASIIFGEENPDKKISLEERHGPTVGNVDRLCSVSNTVKNVCTVKQQMIRLTYDFYYATNLTLIFDASILKCQTVDYLPCNIWFVMANGANLVLKNGSQFIGK